MRVRVVDERALASVKPRSIRLYLQTRNWARQGEASSIPDVWTLLTQDGTYEVIAPSSQQARDYSQRVAELLRTLAIAEDRSELDVLSDLRTLRFDVQYVRTRFSTIPGTAPLGDVAAAFAAAREMLSASTASLETPQLVLPSRPPSRTKNLMEEVLAGPTREGSYVISIWVPIPELLTPDEDLVLFDRTIYNAEGEPFARQATKHLHQSLLAARDAASEALETEVVLDAFVARETSGVSANLCDALVRLAGEQAAGFDVQFAWALDRPVTGLVPQITFREETIPVLRDAARELREEVPEDDVTLRGRVVRLHREGESGPGEVTILGFRIDDELAKSRHVRFDLAEADYRDAIQAHERNAQVQVAGLLIQRGTQTHLTDSRDFVVLPPADAPSQ